MSRQCSVSSSPNCCAVARIVCRSTRLLGKRADGDVSRTLARATIQMELPASASSGAFMRAIVAALGAHYTDCGEERPHSLSSSYPTFAIHLPDRPLGRPTPQSGMRAFALPNTGRLLSPSMGLSGLWRWCRRHVLCRVRERSPRTLSDPHYTISASPNLQRPTNTCINL
jgi:hypothetical protein